MALRRPVDTILTVFLACAFLGCKASPEATVKTSIPVDLDLVILNGRVMDPESKLDAVRNVGVKDGKIVAVTEQAIEGAQTIDAKDHVVAPGFIDTHVHVIDQPFAQKLLLRDGVTTPLDLEVGAAPVDRFYDTMEGKSQTCTTSEAEYGSESPQGRSSYLARPGMTRSKSW